MVRIASATCFVLLLASTTWLAACSPAEPPPPPDRPAEKEPVLPVAAGAAVVLQQYDGEESRAKLRQAAKNITLLDPDEFPEAPPELRQALKALGCRIPQSMFTYLRDFDPPMDPQDNLVSGHFKSSSEVHWAVLCSRSEQTSLLLFDSLGQNMETLFGPDDNMNFLDGFYRDDDYGFFWRLGTAATKKVIEDFPLDAETPVAPPILLEALFFYGMALGKKP